MRGATSYIKPYNRLSRNFNPRPTCVGRHGTGSHAKTAKTLQSTPHMRGATSSFSMSISSLGYFNPRPTCVGRHLHLCCQREYNGTSIHAPHAWGDISKALRNSRSTYFNPRPTCVGRLGPFCDTRSGVSQLQSTPHMRGATDLPHGLVPEPTTSIHAPHAWGDSYILCNFHNIQHFLSFYLIKSIISISNILYDKKSKVRNR